MIIGDRSVFAIESKILKAFDRPSFRALGQFNIHLGGHCYGVDKLDASMVACSFVEIKRRLDARGTHRAPFSAEPNAGKLADAFRDAIYAPGQENRLFFGLPHTEFCNILYSKTIIWAPDGDAAFDDGSYVLQFDVSDQVRLIAFKTRSEGYHHDPATITDTYMSADKFYQVLHRWQEAFELEWEGSCKSSE